jgi:two-component sensor histidine kinase
MLSGVENFCFRHAIEKKTANKLQLISEELVINIIAPKYGACELNLNFSEKLGTYELTVSYEGKNLNVLEDAEDELSLLMIKNSANEIRHTYGEGLNVITADIF